MRLQAGDDYAAAFAAVTPYLAEGLIVEELIQLEQEYSYDGIAHLHFMTEKLSVIGKYPVEYGQIVPAVVSPKARQLITRAGVLANLITGQFLGPFHNEIKIDEHSDQVAVIEPNRRPAGMKIWHLAEKVYGLNFFQLWVDSVNKKALPDQLPAPKGRAGIRLLGVPRDGKLNLSTTIELDAAQLLNQVLHCFRSRYKYSLEIEWFDFKLHARSGDVVKQTPTDNSGFIGQICAYIEDETISLRQVLDDFHQCWLMVINDYLVVGGKQ